MEKYKRYIRRSEKGLVVIIALLILLVLTLIGISAISTTTFETNISGNERLGAKAFYASEAGVQVGLNKLGVNQPPDYTPISRTKVGEDSYYWGGTPKDKGNPKPIQYIGKGWMPGFQVPGSEPTPGDFLRYQVNATGESFGATKEIEIQVRYGPVSTQY